MKTITGRADVSVDPEGLQMLSDWQSSDTTISLFTELCGQLGPKAVALKGEAGM
jgi:hypothetical protein